MDRTIPAVLYLQQQFYLLRVYLGQNSLGINVTDLLKISFHCRINTVDVCKYLKIIDSSGVELILVYLTI
jgi:hypothetical protein